MDQCHLVHISLKEDEKETIRNSNVQEGQEVEFKPAILAECHCRVFLYTRHSSFKHLLFSSNKQP